MACPVGTRFRLASQPYSLVPAGKTSLDSPYHSIRPLWVCRAIVLAGLAVAFCCGASNAVARSQSDATGLAWNADESDASQADAPPRWGERLRGVVQDKLAPIYESFAGLLRPAVANRTWGGSVYFKGVVPGADGVQPEFSRAFAADISQGAGAAQDSFSPLMLNPRRFRVPWLLAPSNSFHAMPVMPVATIGPVHVEIVAASLGVNSGTSAASLQFSMRF